MKEKKSNKFLLLWYSYPRIAVAIVLLSINLAVIFLFTAILSLISGNAFFDELSYLFTYTMCSDGIYDFVNNQEDVWCFIVKIVLTVIQMVIFSGALIGFTTDIIQNTFDNRLKNKGKMHLKNHFVFLNWSTIGQNIIRDISFLDADKTVVILTEDDREEVLNSIDDIFIATGRKKKGLRIFVKKGDPTSPKHLADISISEAKHVGVLLPNHDSDADNDVSTKDLTALKLMLLMLGEAPKANIVVETESEVAKNKIEQLITSTHPEDAGRISVFSHNSVMGHVLGRTTINPLFAPLFHHVLSFEGAEFYGIPTMDLEEALYTYSDCIPIVNYDDDDKIDENGNKQADRLYVLSDNEQTLGIRQDKKVFVKPLKYKEKILPEDFTLFIFSGSNRVQFVVSELENYNRIYNANIRHEIFSYDDKIEDVVQKIIDTEGIKKILLLSEERNDIAEQDSAIFHLLLYLKTNLGISKETEIYVELVNIDNMVPIHNLGIVSVILTNKIISLYMLQLLTHAESRRFFRDVLLINSDTSGIDFEIISADQLLEFDSDKLEFSCYSEAVQSFFIAADKKKMLLGYFSENADEIKFFCDDMDRPRKVQIMPKDKLVIATYNQ